MIENSVQMNVGSGSSGTALGTQVVGLVELH